MYESAQGLNGGRARRELMTEESVTERTLPAIKPSVLSLSKHERLCHPPFDKLRVNGVPFLFEEGSINSQRLYNHGPINTNAMIHFT